MDLLFEQNFSLCKLDDKTNIFLPFQVTKPYQRLIIYWHYAPHLVTDGKIAAQEIERCCRRYLPEDKWPREPIDPKQFEPIFNFVTLSLDSPSGYVGCAHRHDANMRLFLSEAAASPGFEPHSICPGRWRAVLHVHSVIQEPVAGVLRIVGMEGAERV